MSADKRSAVMSRIKGKNTGPERAVAELLALKGLNWEPHAADLPGRPDFVFRDARVVVFVDGDFWHGWQFPRRQHKLSLKWELKIEATRKRDRRNHQRLRRRGWKVVRIWEHQIKWDIDACIVRILENLEEPANSDNFA
jgi:DNA mismatch endonuclease (patch repair protein)